MDTTFTPTCLPTRDAFARRTGSFAAILLLVAWTPSRADAPPLPEFNGKWAFGVDGFPVPPEQITREVSPRTVQLLVDAYGRAATPQDEVQLLHDLGACGSPAGNPAVEKGAADPDPLVRAAAAEAAGKTGDKAVAQALAADPDAGVRREAVLAAAAAGVPSVASAALNDRDEAVVAAALRSVASGGDADAVASLLARLPAPLKPAAAEALGRLGKPEQAAVLEPLLAGGVADKVAAVAAVAGLKAAGEMDKVRPLLSDENPAVRREAVAALGAIATADERLASAMKALGVSGRSGNPDGPSGDPDPSVREAAARVLTAYPSDQAPAALASWLGDGYTPLHDAAREALVATGDAAVPSAVKLLSDPDPRRREDGSYVLGRLGSDAGLDQHVKLLSFDRNPSKNDIDLMIQACTSMAELGPKAAPATDALVKLLAWSKEAPASAEPGAVGVGPGAALEAPALYALARVGYKPVLKEVPPLLQPPTMKGPSPYLQGVAVWAVGVLADPEHDAADKKLCDGVVAMIQRNAGPAAARLENPEDPTVLFEAMKALGNAGYAPAAPLLKTYAANPPPWPDVRVRWMAHAACDRITGQATEYVPPPLRTQSLTPDVSVRDLP